MLQSCLVVALILAGTTASLAASLPPLSRGTACGRGVQHVALLSPAQMCPRPLATTVIAPARHGILHT